MTIGQMDEGISTQQWPPDCLETLGACPVCGYGERATLYDGLIDSAFGCAPGTWSMQRCVRCRNAYLDPRPDEKSIGNAYSSYYTHNVELEREEFDAIGIVRKLRRLVSNSYTNWRYGTDFSPSHPYLALLLRSVPSLRQGLDVQYRWLPKPAPGDKVLDVGCGNGAFLRAATECGWEAFGADPDEMAIQRAKPHCKEARRGGIEAYSEMAGEFRAITLSHSIEHTHDPVQVIRDAARLLRDDGLLYVDTPNIDSRGRFRFGPDWRGLEAPRHLVLFTAGGLEEVLRREGFVVEKRMRRTAVAPSIFCSSQMTADKRGLAEMPSRSVRLKALVWGLFSALASTSRLEFITLIAQRSTR